MNENRLDDLSMDFAVDIVNLTDRLKANGEHYIADQLIKSGTGIGLSISGAQYVQGKREFLSSLESAYKAASESCYWLTLLHRTNKLGEQEYRELFSKCSSLRSLLASTSKMARER